MTSFHLNHTYIYVYMYTYIYIIKLFQYFYKLHLLYFTLRNRKKEITHPLTIQACAQIDE